MSDKKTNRNEQLVEAYNQMMIRVSESLSKATSAAGPIVTKAIEAAEDKAVELEELTREEAVKIGEYLRRDLQDAGEYLVSPEAEELKDWLRFDIELIEKQLFEMFLKVADRTKLDMLDFEEKLAEANEYHTGQITGPGTLVCDSCGELLHFHQAGHIPPCPKCHHTEYSRQNED